MILLLTQRKKYLGLLE